MLLIFLPEAEALSPKLSRKIPPHHFSVLNILQKVPVLHIGTASLQIFLHGEFFTYPLCWSFTLQQFAPKLLRQNRRGEESPFVETSFLFSNGKMLRDGGGGGAGYGKKSFYFCIVQIV
jgi:hypothetical protein